MRNYQKGPYVRSYWALGNPNVDSRSAEIAHHHEPAMCRVETKPTYKDCTKTRAYGDQFLDLVQFARRVLAFEARARVGTRENCSNFTDVGGVRLCFRPNFKITSLNPQPESLNPKPYMIHLPHLPP